MKKNRLLAMLLALCLLAGCTATPATETGNPSETALPVEAAAQSYEESIEWHGVYDVVVAGYGGAGATAAFTAADLGASVLIVEKAPKGHEGGNTRYCGQITLATEDVGAMSTYLRGVQQDYDTVSDAMCETFAEGLGGMVNWMGEMGANVDNMVIGGKAEWPEFEGSESKQAIYIDGEMLTGKVWNLVKDNVEKRGEAIEVWYEAPATELIQDPFTKVILGLKVESGGEVYNIRATKGVILCTGGFENNEEMVENYLGFQQAYPVGTTYNTGDGIRMAQAVGAKLWHMANVSAPYLNAVNKETGRSMSVSVEGTDIMRTSNIMVGPDGTRFLNEALKSKHIKVNYHGGYAVRAVPYPCYLILDDNAMQTHQIYPYWSKGNPEGLEQGYVVQGSTVRELAQKIGVNPEGLEAEVARYNGFCADGVDPVYGRPADTLFPLEKGPYYAMELKPTILNTQGGPERNEKGEVLDVYDQPIPHLYSAGEMGAIWSFLYEGAGNLAEALIFGRIAAETAMQNTDYAPSPNLSVQKKAPVQNAEVQQDLKENEFIGVGAGLGGELSVKVSVEDGKLASVEVLTHSETPGISDTAIEEMPGRIVQADSTQVDTCSGCTVTSKAIQEAVDNALLQAAEKGLYTLKEKVVEEEKEIVMGPDDYAGTGDGTGGELTLKVTYVDGKITAIERIREKESTKSSAVDVMAERIIAANSTEVDTITGATTTCKAVIEAVDNAIKEAKK